MRTDPGGTPGQEGAPTSLTDQQLQTVQRICRSRVRAADAEDAAQETVVQFLTADHSRIDKPDAWLAAVAVRVCARVHRGRYRANEVPLDDRYPDGAADPAERATTDVLLRDIAQALPSSDLFILRRIYFDDVPFAQLAAELQVTESHARVLAFRARRRAANFTLSRSDPRPGGGRRGDTPSPRWTEHGYSLG